MIGVKEEGLTAYELINEWRETREFHYAIKIDSPRFDKMYFIDKKQWKKIENNIPVLDGASREGIDILMTTVNIYHYTQRFRGNYGGKVDRPDKILPPYQKKIDYLYNLIDGLPAFYDEKIALTNLSIKLHKKEFGSQVNTMPKKATSKSAIKSTINWIIEEHNLSVKYQNKIALINSL